MYFIQIQEELEAYFPPIQGNKDYLEFKNILDRMDLILREGGLEQKVVELAMKTTQRKLSSKEKMEYQKHIIKALRCNIVKDLTGLSFRELSIRLSDSLLFQKFCNLITIDKIHVPGKSALEVYSKMFDQAVYRELVSVKIKKAAEVQEDGRVNFDLKAPLSLENYFADSTCIEANIHFPVDWVLLRDGCRTLCKAVLLLRQQGLKNRMRPPEDFMKKMNQMCIAMTHSRRKKGSKKHRKEIFRKMKRLIKIVVEHAKKHKQLLDQNWQSTELSRKQTEQILKRIDRILEQLPQAMTQAHERIIGERQVAGKNKLLSLYESKVNVIVRGKAGAEVEFGNTLMIAEQSDGIVIDWEFIRDSSPGDATLIQTVLERSHENLQTFPEALAGDRGFNSDVLSAFLEKNKIFNGICPKSVPEMLSKFENEKFVALQTRRSQTEARISILRKKFFGKPIRSKGHEHREIEIASSIFAHNLWVLARLPLKESIEELPLAA